MLRKVTVWTDFSTADKKEREKVRSKVFLVSYRSK